LAETSLPERRAEAHRGQRECRSCYGGGWVLLDATYDPETGELVQEEAPCPICDGSGSVYLYERS
jgi:hypothetical protein